VKKVRNLKKEAHGTPALAAGNAFARPVFARIRRLCLSLPESSEALAWGHPTFKAGRKMFCAFEIIGGRPSVAFRLPAADVTATLKHVRCFASPYGRGLWVSVWVDGAVDRKQIEQFIEHSYRTVATKRHIAALELGTSA
jgi:predicted DNA-binding protein (MmcQ/YjbR family)